MTLLFMDSFQGGEMSPGKWSGSTGTPARATSTPRTSGAAYASWSSFGSLTRSFTAASEVFIAGGMYTPASGAIPYIQLLGDSAATTHLTIIRNTSSGFLELRRGSTAGTLLATGTTAVPTTTWTHIQIRATIADSGGVCQVRINGSSTPDIDYSGDTKNAGTNTTIDAVIWGSNASSGAYLADVVILNTSGSVNNTWAGDVKVVALSPSGDGNASQWLGSDGNSVSNYQQVDETPFSSADYNGDSVSGHQDVYALADLAAGITDIRAVQVCASLAKSDAGAVQAKIVAQSGSTDYLSGAITPSTSYLTYTSIYETDPATSATWTASNVNALQAGAQIV